MIDHELSRDIADAIKFIPTTIEATERYKVLAALKSLEDDTGSASLVAEWLEVSTEKALAILSKVNVPKSITLASLYYIATEHGYKPNDGLSQLSEFSATEHYNDRWCRKIPNLTGIVAIKSPKGSGKTEQIKSLVNDASSCIIPGHRKTLLRQMASRVSTSYYEEHKTEELDKLPKLAVTLDSLIKLKSVGQYSLVVIDEVCQVLRHLMGDTVKGDRPNVLATLQALLKRSDRVIVLDADLSDVECQFLEDLTNKPTYKIHNTHKTDKGTIELHEAINDALKSGDIDGTSDKCFVACNTRKGAELAARYYENLGYRVKLITSETSQYETDFITRINAGSMDDFDYLVVSPSLSTGVDIQIPMKVLGIVDAFRGLNASDICQHIARVRNPLSIDLWCTDSTVRSCTNWKALRQAAIDQSIVLQEIDSNGTRVVSSHSGEAEYLDLWAKTTAKHNASVANLRESLLEQLTNEGYEIIEAKTVYDSDSMEDIKTLKSEVINDYLQSIVKASPEDTDTKKYGVQADVRKIYGEVTLETVYDYDEGRIRDRIEAYQTFRDAKLGLTPDVLLTGLATDFPINVAIGLFASEVLSKWVEHGSVESKEFKEWATRQKTRSTLLLGSEARGVKLLSSVLERCGLCLVSGKQSRKAGRKRSYSVTGESRIEALIDNLSSALLSDIPTGVEY